jgi:hypothetical protein
MGNPKKRAKLTKPAKNYVKTKLEIKAQVVEAQQSIADIEKEIAAEDLSPRTLLPDEPESVAQLRFEADKANKIVGEEGMFTYCPTCNDPKIARGQAAERAKKTEMILTVRDLVDKFKSSADARLAALSSKIEEQLKPIVAMTSQIAVARKELDLQLVTFEDELHKSMGLDGELDPEVVSKGLFGEAIADSVAPPPQPASLAGLITCTDTFNQPATAGMDALIQDETQGEPHELTLEEIFDADDAGQYRQ